MGGFFLPYMSDTQSNFVRFGGAVCLFKLVYIFCTLVFYFKTDRHYTRPQALVWTGWTGLDWLGTVGIGCAESHGPRRGLGKQEHDYTARMCPTAF